MEITSVHTLWGFPPGNEYSMLTASSANMHHDRGETGSSHYCKLILSSAWDFWIIKKFPLHRSKEFSSAACVGLPGRTACLAARWEVVVFLWVCSMGWGGGGEVFLASLENQSFIIIFYFLSYFMQQ